MSNHYRPDTLSDMTAPIAASALQGAAERKMQHHEARAAHWETKARQLYDENRDASLQGFEQIGQPTYSGSAVVQGNADLQFAVQRLNYHRHKTHEFRTAMVAFAAHDTYEDQRILDVPIRILAELDIAGFVLRDGAVASED